MPGYLVLKQAGNQLSGTAGPDADHQFAVRKGVVATTEVSFEAGPGDTVLRFVVGSKDDQLSVDLFEDDQEN